MSQKVMRVGNSIGVTVPSQFVKAVGVRVGDSVKVKTILETGQVIYTFQGAKQLSLHSLPKQ
ncbi:MAG: AbrB/MazE/SpoVT family DNA-binding domain-containing protein [Patescibacteria group bacterium]|nr:AbrB/MazE/SpoVT family DNA-binding domain-containing protein [Patescibacteria group bacterium]